MTMHDAMGPTSLSAADATELAAQIEGPVLLPDDDGYAAECATFNLLTPVFPAVAVGATSVGDVQAAVRFAARRRRPVAVLATGHQVVCSAEGAVLINVSRLNAVHIDPAWRLARAEGGVRGGQLVEAAGEHDLAPISGASPTVGVVGFNLGGGHSPLLGRTYGFAADHVQAIDIVTADGELRRVTGSSEPDLFWALRGAKGNFGVVTALELSLFPVARFYGGGLFFSGEHAAKVLHTWREWVAGLPVEMSSSIAFLRPPPRPNVPEQLRGTFVVHVRFSSLGPRAEAERLLGPLRSLAPTVMDTIADLSLVNAAMLHMDPPEPVPMTERAMALRDFPQQAADSVLAALGPDSGTHVRFMELRALGGALAQPPATPNAVPGRTAPWSLIAAGSGAPDRALIRQELIALTQTLAPWTQEETTPNLLTPSQGTTRHDVRAAYGSERYDRLVTIKQRYDPDNLFRMNHNITPA